MAALYCFLLLQGINPLFPCPIFGVHYKLSRLKRNDPAAAVVVVVEPVDLVGNLEELSTSPQANGLLLLLGFALHPFPKSV
ncbi:MAG: hypothetical protein GY941_28660 [Planctomycetes bacterium]|nr:hypothetical protein [Planctomycetota bacterium]